MLHRCDNPGCVRPEHLFSGTRADNNADMVSKGRNVPGGTYGRGRYPRGAEHHGCRLTEADVHAIRASRAGGLSYSKVAAKHGVSIGHTWRICNGKARVGVQIGGEGNEA